MFFGPAHGSYVFWVTGQSWVVLAQKTAKIGDLYGKIYEKKTTKSEKAFFPVPHYTYSKKKFLLFSFFLLMVLITDVKDSIVI